MQTTRPIYASDAIAWERCRRLAWFLFHPPSDERPEPDRFEVLIRERGIEHEAEVLACFQTPVRAESVAHTQQLMAARTPVIYQAQFQHEDFNLVGVPDFLLRAGDQYQVADAKLALSVDKNRAIKTQLGVYQILLQAVAGCSEDELLAPIVFLGDGEAKRVEEDLSQLAQRFLADMLKLVEMSEMPPTHFAFSKCSSCLFIDYCHAEFERQDDVTLSPAVDSRTAKQLALQGLETLSDLAAAEPGKLVEAPYLRNPDKRLRIVQQAKSLKSGEVIIREAPHWPQGTMMHFDVESDPMGADGQGEVYLWGLLKPPYDATGFDAVWRDTDDFATWTAFLSLMTDYRRRYPDLVLVHYSPYERTQIAHYATRYDAHNEPIVQWLLDEQGPLWDLQRFVKLYFILPVESYGLKTICRDPNLVNFQWRLDESGSQWSVVRYYDYVAALAAGKVHEAEEIKREILIYNEDDVRATAAMVDWLIGLST